MKLEEAFCEWWGFSVGLGVFIFCNSPIKLNGSRKHAHFVLKNRNRISSTQLLQLSHVWVKNKKSQFYEGLIHVWKPELPLLDRRAWVILLISLTSMYNCKASGTFYSRKVAKQLVRDIHKLNILKDNDWYGEIRALSIYNPPSHKNEN